MLYGNRERCCVETESDAVLKQSDAVLLNVHHEYYQFFLFLREMREMRIMCARVPETLI